MKILIIIGVGAVVVGMISFIISYLKGTSEKGIEKTLTKMANATIRAQNNVINNNEDILKETADKTANIKKDAVKTIAHSIKEGFSDDDTIYCKYCGAQIDEDSKFCKNCGKELL